MIRTMEARDARAVYDIITRSLGYSCELATVERQIPKLVGDPDQCCLVWEDDATGEARAFLQAQRHESLHDPLGGWDVVNLAVVPEHQGEGIGRALLTHFEQQAAAAGAAYVKLNSRIERTGAHAFYDHLGYANLKTQKYFIKRWE